MFRHVKNGSDYVKSDGTKTPGLTFANQRGDIISAVGFYYLALYDLGKNVSKDTLYIYLYMN